MSMETHELTMAGAYNIVLRKARNNRLIMRRHKLQMRDQERKLQGPVKEFMDYMTKKLRAGISGMSGKTAAQKAKSIVNWDEIRAEGQKILEPAELDVLLVGIDSVTKQRIRKQARIDPIGVEAITWSQAHTAELVVEITATTMEAIEEIITRGIEAGKSIPVVATELRPIVGLHSQYAGAVDKFATELYTRPKYSTLSNAQRNAKINTYAGRLHRRRTQTIARTESAFGLTEGQRQGYAQMGATKLERVEDPDCCDICAEYQGKIYTIAEAEGVLPEHPNCLLGNSFVLPCGDISGVSKRWFEGEIIILETASGRKLSCTPHHPVLTELGFYPANSLNVGSKVVCHGIGQGERLADWYNINKPSTIQKIASSFLKSDGVTTNRMPTSAMDFHGDGAGSKITIIGSNCFLMRGFNSPLKKHSLKLDLIMRKIRGIFLHCFCMLAFRCPAYFSSFVGNMSRFNLIPTLSLGHFSPQQFYALGLGSDLNMLLQQSATNDTATNSKQFGNSFLRISRNIKMNNAINRKIVTYEFPDHISFPWFFDNIIHKKTSKYKGYVYNLETSKSYYIANGIAIHNCEGTWVIAG